MMEAFGGRAEQRTLFMSIRLLAKKNSKGRRTNALAGSVHATHIESNKIIIEKSSIICG
jgi:hypothetical protein